MCFEQVSEYSLYGGRTACIDIILVPRLSPLFILQPFRIFVAFHCRVDELYASKPYMVMNF